MSIKFFGQFLLEENVITPAQLLKALDYQERKNLKFGQYCLSKGFLRGEAVTRLNDEQKRTDMRIGELAVQMRLLNAEQVEHILTMQKNDHVQIGQALVTTGGVTDEALPELLARFKADQAEYIPGILNVPEGVSHPELVRDIVDITIKLMRRIALMEAKADSGQVTTDEPPANYVVTDIHFSGDVTCNYILGMPEQAAKRLASGVVGEDVSKEPRANIYDGVAEFANIACGNILGRMAQKGKNVDIHPPTEVTEGQAVVKGRTSARYTLVTTSGYVSLVIADGKA
jgi:CheY-specific phosphatase CheX